MHKLYLAFGLTMMIPMVIAAWSKETGFLKRQISISGEVHTYQIYVPADWDAKKKWPVILFLHGAGERGSDGEEHTNKGIGPAIRRDPARFPALVVMPQCRRGVMWNDPEMEDLVLSVLGRSIEEFHGNPSRIYLTGLSMGGYGTFYFGAKYPGKFAVLVPVCGGVIPPYSLRTVGAAQLESRYVEVALKIGKTPTWIFHGSDDNRVPVSESRKMAAAIKEVGGDFRYTEYKGVGHNSWDHAYAEVELLPWMLMHSR